MTFAPKFHTPKEEFGGCQSSQKNILLKVPMGF